MGSKKRVLTYFFAVALSLGAVSPAAAESRSTRSVQVSCTIPALFQFSAPRASSAPSVKNALSLDVKTNLMKHSIVETLVSTPGSVRKLVTVTAR